MEVSLQAGAILEERYRLESLLGRGGSGQVWAAVDQHEQRRVAVKVMHQEGAHRTRREVEALGRLHHPAIVRILGQGSVGPLPFVVLELVDGETLRVHLTRRALERRPFAPLELQSLFTPILGALTEAHDQNVIHRDLKPENLVLDRAGRLRILDFGVARLTDTPATAATTLGRMIGSLFYLSPEQSLGHPIDARSDLFSLAVVIYECLTLHRAWAQSEGGGPLSVAEAARLVDNTPVQIITRITSGPRPRASTVAPWLGPMIDPFFARALATEPDQRPPTTLTLGRELAQALADASPPPPGAPLPPSTPIAATIEWSTTQPVEPRTRSVVEPPLDATQADPARVDPGTAATAVQDRPEATRIERPVVTLIQPEDATAGTRTTENQYLPRTVTRPAIGPRAPGAWRPWMLPLFLGALIVGTAAGIKLGSPTSGPKSERPVDPVVPAPAIVVPLPNATQAEVGAANDAEAPPPAAANSRVAKKSPANKRPVTPVNPGLSASLAALKLRADPAAFRRLVAEVRQRAAEVEDPARRQEVERLLFLASAAEDLDSLEKAIDRLQASP